MQKYAFQKMQEYAVPNMKKICTICTNEICNIYVLFAGIYTKYMQKICRNMQKQMHKYAFLKYVS